MASHNARMEQTVEKDLSPPDSDRMSLKKNNNEELPSELVQGLPLVTGYLY